MWTTHWRLCDTRQLQRLAQLLAFGGGGLMPGSTGPAQLARIHKTRGNKVAKRELESHSQRSAGTGPGLCKTLTARLLKHYHLFPYLQSHLGCVRGTIRQQVFRRHTSDLGQPKEKAAGHGVDSSSRSKRKRAASCGSGCDLKLARPLKRMRMLEGHPTAWALGIWDKRALLRRLESEGPCPQRHRSSSTTPARLFRHFSCPSSSAEPSATTDKPLMASLRSRRARVPPTVPASCFQQAPSTPLDAPLTEAGTWPPSVQPHSRRTMPRAPISCFQQAASAAAGPSCKHRSSPQVPASCFQQDTSSLYEADMTSDEDQPSCLEGCRRRYGPCLPVSGFQLEASIPADGWQSSFGPVKAALMPVASTGGYAQGISRPKISRIQDSAAAGLSPPTNLLAKSGAAASFKLPSALSGGAEQGTTAASIGPVTRPAYSMLAEKAKGMVVQPSLARSGSFSFNSAVQLSHGALLPPTAFEAWWFRQGSSGVGDAPGQPGTATASRTKSHDLPCMAGSLDSSSTEEHSGNFDGTVRICVDAGATVLSVPAGQPQPIAHFDGDAYLFRDAYGWSHGASHPDGRQLPGQPHSGPDQFDGDAYLFRDAPSPASHAPVESLEHGCDCLAPAFSFSPADQEDPVGMSPWPPCLGH